VYAASDDPKDGLWYAWPDLVSSVLLTGKIPRIVEAFRIEPLGKLKGLKPILFRGQVPIDPGVQDFFRAVIEERVRLTRRADLDKTERGRLTKSLTASNSAGVCVGRDCTSNLPQHGLLLFNLHRKRHWLIGRRHFSKCVF
jgi:hypothetical protein